MGDEAPWVIDLDGVVWSGRTVIDGSIEAIAALVRCGHPVWFCTNNSSVRIADYEERLADLGVDAAGRVLSSALAVASLVVPGERVLCCTEAGVRDALDARGVVVLDPRHGHHDDVDTVIVGLHRDFGYEILRSAVRAVLGGARLLATNDDPIYPDTDGPAPGCGSILASVERATGCQALVAGKPNAPMVDLVRRAVGPGPGVVVGDSPATDGALARQLGWPFGLVLSGNTPPGADVVADWCASDLAALVGSVLGPAR